MEMAVVSLSTGVESVWGMAEWTRPQELLVLTRDKVGTGQVGIGLCTGEPHEIWVWWLTRWSWAIATKSKS